MQANPNAKTNGGTAQQVVGPPTAKETDQRATTQQPAEEPPHPMPTIGDWLTIGFTGVIALMAIAQFIVFRRQWKVMSGQLATMDGQLAEMKTTTQQLEKLVQQAAENTKSSQLSAEAAKETAVIAKETAEASKQTAEAALLNAQAFMNAERAWIIPKMQSAVPGAEAASLILVNSGRTPAEIIGVRRRDLFPQRLGDLPDAPDFGPETEFTQTRILSAGESWDFELTSFAVIPPEMIDDIRASRQRFVVAYIVQYRDLLSNTLHESRVCYFWNPLLKQFTPTGPPEYTKYT